MTLTDADRAAIALAAGNAIFPYGEHTWAERLYIIGKRAGIEEAAKVCDGLELEWYHIASDQKHIDRAIGAGQCGREIRALSAKDAEAPP